ncbi:hydroxymethylglutaryl-CoA lyase [Parapedobacter lycopersici]|uniref:hydroxymethylglutaryl-CoA lyase n=1 Tax=Parapedobacter lycopersici TaxID=1864939 RepID=UPI00333F5C71
MLSITECPRDAMQGIDRQIPTAVKVNYLQRLLAVGFSRLDFGSFVSHRAVPQLRDTAAVLGQLDTAASATQLLAIVANVRGAREAAGYPAIHVLGFPFSVSETFQLRNTGRTIAQSLEIVREMAAVCRDQGKQLLIYLSMGFGNPYGDPWGPDIVAGYAAELAAIGIREMAVADTVGSAAPRGITEIYTRLTRALPGVALGLHLHSTPATTRSKLAAALDAGCDRFDTALRGFGGCPMAADRLTGNIATETLLDLAAERQMPTGLDMQAWQAAMQYSNEVFLP